MDCCQLPFDVVGLIIRDHLEDVSLAAGLQLRLVSRAFNQEVLYAFFDLQAPNFRNRWPHGHIIPFDNLAMVRYLHGFATRSIANSKGNIKHGCWLNTIESGAEILRQLLPDPDSTTLLHERGTVVEYRRDAEWVYRRIVCEAMVSFLGPGECFASIIYDELSSNMGTPFLCILNRPVSFWMVVAACHIGSCSAVEQAITTLRQTFPKELDWRAHLNGCMFVAAQGGHIDVVRLLINLGLDANGRSYRGFDRFIGGDGTALCGASRFGCLDTVDHILKQGVMGERLAYEWALYECVKGRDKCDVRVAILERLLEEAESTDNPRSVYETILLRAFRLNNLRMTKAISDHISSTAQASLLSELPKPI